MKKEEVLTAFAKEEFLKLKVAYDEKAVDLLASFTEMKEAPPDAKEAHRVLTGKRSSSGDITWESIKLFNLMQVSHYELIKLIVGQVGILIDEVTGRKALLALLLLLLEFYPNLKISFEGQDADVLFAIAQLQKKKFKAKEISDAYTDNFHEQLAENKLNASLGLLVDTKVLRRMDADTFELREKIKNLKR